MPPVEGVFEEFVDPVEDVGIFPLADNVLVLLLVPVDDEEDDGV